MKYLYYAYIVDPEPGRIMAKGWFTGIVIVIFLLAACSAAHTELAPGASLTAVEQILVLPFEDLTTKSGINDGDFCPLCQKRHFAENVDKIAPEYMTQHLYDLLNQNQSYHFIYLTSEDRSLPNANDNRQTDIREIAAALGKSKGADAVLLGHLHRFKERVGASYSVVSPASVSFSLYLINVTDSQVIWRGTFEETQQSLSENLLRIGSFIKRKARWVTAQELAAEGLENLISGLTKP